jgi:hypothetical protein
VSTGAPSRSARSANGRQSVCGAVRAGSAEPRGDGSDGGAVVPSDAVHISGARSSRPSGQTVIRSGVTSIHMRAKYQSIDRSAKAGRPRKFCGVLTRDSRR